ncbi:response regulator transcription factor [Pseudoteredinibacter isoporae]|uniref:response regulator transcription factor n=1 Tax=Pseudoteredinibacter isoporae TaxID=570281 RepID=UPI00310B9CC3
MLILIVEDDRDLSANIAAYLEMHEMECDFAYNGVAALQLCEENSYDLIILDIMMPRMDGYTVCQTLQDRGIDTPILILTACDDDQEQLRGFSAGADDYVSKPCSLAVLKARIDAIKKRQLQSGRKLSIHDMVIDVTARTVERQGQAIKLSPTAFKLLTYLAQRSPKVVSREELHDHLWPDKEVKASNLNVHVHAIRTALDKPFDCPLLHTEIGTGLAIR